MAGDHTHARCHQTSTRHRSGFAVAAEVEILRNATSIHQIGTAESRHSRSTHQLLVRQILKHGIHQHRLVFRHVERFADNIFITEQHRHVLVGHFHGINGDIDKRIDLTQVTAQCFRFVLPKILQKILLTIQIRHIHAIKINQMQVTDADAGQRHRNRRSETAAAANGHVRRVELVLRGCGMAVEQGCADFFAADEHGRGGLVVESVLAGVDLRLRCGWFKSHGCSRILAFRSCVVFAGLAVFCMFLRLLRVYCAGRNRKKF